jgi:hypothetical protein
MIEWRAEDLLYLRLGTEMPDWSIAADSDMLVLAAGHSEQCVGVRLSSLQLAKIRTAKDGLVRTSVRVIILGAHLRLYLVGRKVNDHVWKGRSSGDVNFLHMPSRTEGALTYPPRVADLATAY